jgi:hypothetical protein
LWGRIGFLTHFGDYRSVQRDFRSYRVVMDPKPAAQPQQRTVAVCRLAASQAARQPAARLHPDDLAQLASRVADELAPRIMEQVARCLVAQTTAAEPTATDARLAPTSLLTVDEVLAARPGMSRSWLYGNAADCGAIRKNHSRRSPLWFRLIDVDAELDQRRRRPTRETVETAVLHAPRHRRTTRRTDGTQLTANGAPRSFDVRPPRAA